MRFVPHDSHGLAHVSMSKAQYQQLKQGLPEHLRLDKGELLHAPFHDDEYYKSMSSDKFFEDTAKGLERSMHEWGDAKAKEN